LVIEPHFPDDSAKCRQYVVFASGYRRGRRFLIDLSIFRRLLYARYAISAEMF